MMRSLFAGVSALRNHQIRMDVIANNIANVNTIGFKASRVTFQEMLSQKIRDASAPQGSRGGTNPIQVGLGSSLATINVNHTQGNSETTNVDTDLMIEGAGYFVVGDGLERYYTRAGMLLFDRDGSLVLDGTGLKVLGWMADDNGNIDTTAPLQELRIPSNVVIPPQAATSIRYAGNLDSRTTGELAVSPFTVTSGADTAQVTFKFTPTGNFNEFRWEVTVTGGDPPAVTSGIVRVDEATGNITWEDNAGNAVGNLTVSWAGNPNDVTITLPGNTGSLNFDWDNGAGGDTGSEMGTFTDAPEKVTTIAVYDSLGNQHEVVTHFIKRGDNAWEWIARDVFGTEIGRGNLTFDTSGRLIAQTGEINFNPPGQAAAPLQIQPDFSGIYQVAEAASAQAIDQNGFPAGKLADYSIDSRGVINGSFSNGLNRPLGQIALAAFANPPGLAKVGNNLYTVTPNSGQPVIGAAGTGDLGEIQSGRLEMSNVDLSQEFTNMIITQRGFQANSRIITTSDELLQELVNLKR